MVFRAAAVLLAATLAGCGGAVVTDPDAVGIEPFRLALLRPPQAVTLINGLTTPVKYQVRTRSSTWEVDCRQMTDTAIIMLRRALEKHGTRVAPQSGKTVTFRIQMRGASPLPGPVPPTIARAWLTLEADFGDGTATWVDGDGAPHGTHNAFEGAIQSALHRLLLDQKFLAYMDR